MSPVIVDKTTLSSSVTCLMYIYLLLQPILGALQGRNLFPREMHTCSRVYEGRLASSMIFLAERPVSDSVGSDCATWCPYSLSIHLYIRKDIFIPD